MLIAIVDTETTGLDPSQHQIIELAVVVFDTDHNCVVQTLSTLMPVSENPAEKWNNISAASTAGVVNTLVAPAIELINSCDAISTHRAPFDRSFLPNLLPRWVDTLDIWWPKATRQRCNLRELAGYYAIPVWKPHRALTDCLLLSEIFQAESSISELMEENPLVWACTGCDWDDKDTQAQIKEAGFWWNDDAAPVAKTWSRTIYQRDISKLPFKVRAYRER